MGVQGAGRGTLVGTCGGEKICQHTWGRYSMFEPGTVVFHCYSTQKQLRMVTAFLLRSTHHIPTHHHVMRA